MNLFSPDIEVTSVPLYTNYTRLKQDQENLIETTAEHRWITIVAELVLAHTVNAYEIISSLKSQAVSSEPNSAP